MLLKHTPTPWGSHGFPARAAAEATYLGNGHTHPASLETVNYELQRK